MKTKNKNIELENKRQNIHFYRNPENQGQTKRFSKGVQQTCQKEECFKNQ
jgi:hypothetical protein